MSDSPLPIPCLDEPAVSVDASFNKYRHRGAAVQRLAHGFYWAEGPVWRHDARALVFSDVPGNAMYEWDEETGSVAPYRQPSNNANGNTNDQQGRLVTCEQRTRRVTRTERDGGITVLADRFEDRRLNSPNDVVTASDGSIWFTDPTFGIDSSYEGEKGEAELPTHVYRLDAHGLRVVAEGLKQPNGLAFSPDESVCYVVESGTSPNRLIAFDVTTARSLTNPRALIDAGEGALDGLRCDTDGNLWCGFGGPRGLDGVHVFNPDGRLIGRIILPERCANLCFGGIYRDRLFMAASSSLYAVYVNARGGVCE